MKNIISLIVILTMLTVAANAQVEKSPIVKFLNKRGYTFPDQQGKRAAYDTLQKWPDTVYYNTVYKATLLGSPTIPISFSRIELINGKYQVSPALSIGYGYTWFFGDFIFNENDKITVDPGFFFGLVGEVALQNDFSFNKLTGFFTEAFIGFGNFSLFGGYDFISKSAALSLGGRIDLYTMKQDALHPIGKVYEARKHKRIAPAIENE